MKTTNFALLIVFIWEECNLALIFVMNVIQRFFKSKLVYHTINRGMCDLLKEIYLFIICAYISVFIYPYYNMKNNFSLNIQSHG